MVNYSPSPYPFPIKGEGTVLGFLNRDLGIIISALMVIPMVHGQQIKALE